MSRRPVDGEGAASKLDRSQLPWRSMQIGATAVGAPAAISCSHPAFGLVLASSEAATILIVLAAALFGTSTISERAFRLLRWFADRPEPAAPPVTFSPTTAAAPDDPTAPQQ